MIVKSIITSFAVTLTSALDILREHGLLVFITLYALHLLISYFIARVPVTHRSGLPTRSSPRLQNWARDQHSRTFTSF